MQHYRTIEVEEVLETSWEAVLEHVRVGVRGGRVVGVLSLVTLVLQGCIKITEKLWNLASDYNSHL